MPQLKCKFGSNGKTHKVNVSWVEPQGYTGVVSAGNKSKVIVSSTLGGIERSFKRAVKELHYSKVASKV